MGIHEGSHAYTAWRLGDNTAYSLGKRTFDPFHHINWSDFSSVLFGVIMPVVTALTGRIPMGMAWVPVNPGNFRRPIRDHAIVAAAGPLSNFALAILLLPPHIAIQHFAAPGSVFELLDLLFYAIYITSIIYGLFNSIPLPPLDGSRVLYAILPRAWQDVMDDIEPYGFAILIALFWFGSAGRLLHAPIGFFQRLWG